MEERTTSLQKYQGDTYSLCTEVKKIRLNDGPTKVRPRNAFSTNKLTLVSTVMKFGL